MYKTAFFGSLRGHVGDEDGPVRGGAQIREEIREETVEASWELQNSSQHGAN